jgi:hypothetical protein
MARSEHVNQYSPGAMGDPDTGNWDPERNLREFLNALPKWREHGVLANILVESNNECNVSYHPAILKPDRIPEMIELAKGITRSGTRLLVGTSYRGGTPAQANVVRSSDFRLLHGNGPTTRRASAR